MRVLTATAIGLLCVTLAGCGKSAQKGSTVRVSNDPARFSLVVGGHVVAAEAPGARLRYRLLDGTEHRLTALSSHDGSRYVFSTDESGRTAVVTVRLRPHGVRLTAQLRPGAGVREVYDAFEATTDDHFLGGGERGGAVDLRGSILPVKTGPCSYAPVPFYASSAGYGLRLRSRNVSALAFPGSAGGSGCRYGEQPACTFPALTDRVEVCVQGSLLDEDIYAGSFAEVLAAYQADTGPARVPPESELELIKWRDEVSGPAELLDDIARFRGAGIPIGWVLLDNPWEACNGQLAFDPDRFPDPDGTIRQVHALGVKFMLWVSPRETCPEGFPATSLLGEPGHHVLDFRNPAALAEYKRRIRRLYALGVDGVKGDRGDEVDLDAVAPSLTNDYPLQFAHAVLDELPKGGAAMFRAGAMGSQAVLPGLWAGDQQGIWSGLEVAIIAGETAGMSGFSAWGSDIGGYTSLQPTPVTADVFIRWAQLGAVSPIMEVGGIGPNATPWTLGTEAMAALKDAAILHYELFPYLYGLLQAGQPVLRPLGYAYPDDPGAWEARLEFMVGPDLLAAPVTGPGTTPSVYLPEGSWVDLYTGETVEGGRSFTRDTPMTSFPLYARSGAAIEFNLRTETGSWWGTDELRHPGRVGLLATDGSTVAVPPGPTGIQIFIPTKFRPSSVTIGGSSVSWKWNPGPLPGVVVRLHARGIEGRVSLGAG